MRASLTILSIVGISLLSACSSVVHDKLQYIRIETPDADGAACELRDYREYHYKIRNTPDAIKVEKGYPPLRVTCHREGFETTTVKASEIYDPLVPGDFVADKLGYVLADYRHASHVYPATVVVWMRPLYFESAEAEAEWEKKVENYYKEEALRLEQNDKTIRGKSRYTKKKLKKAIDDYNRSRRKVPVSKNHEIQEEDIDITY